METAQKVLEKKASQGLASVYQVRWMMSRKKAKTPSNPSRKTVGTGPLQASL